MDPTLLAGIVGAIGGAARATIGLCKSIATKKRIIWSYYFLTILTAAIIGSACGIIFNFDTRLALLAGYSGTDLLEGVYKAFGVQKVLVR